MSKGIAVPSLSLSSLQQLEFRTNTLRRLLDRRARELRMIRRLIPPISYRTAFAQSRKSHLASMQVSDQCPSLGAQPPGIQPLRPLRARLSLPVPTDQPAIFEWPTH